VILQPRIIAVNRADLQKLAEERLEEAEVLLRAKKYSGAYYLAGYAVECALKACLAKRTRRHDFPEKPFADKCYTHDVEKLAVLAQLKTAIEADPLLKANWIVVKDWNEQARYERKTRAKAQELYDAITDPSHGVLPWIKSHW
jgi:HEPN domain-containing protein